jgi:hypothetical protein
MPNLTDFELNALLGFACGEAPTQPEPEPEPEVIYRRLDEARVTGAPFVFQVNRKDFRAYATEKHATAALAKLVEAEVEVFENIDGARPLRAFIDCDASPTASAADLQRVADAFTAEAIALGVPHDKAQPLTLENDRPGKRSRHYLANGWGFSEWRVLKRFEDGVRARVGAAGLPGGLTHVDGLAKRRFALRIPGVPKLDRDGSTIPGSILQPSADDWDANPKYVARQTVAAWLIQGAEPLTIYAKPWDEPEADAAAAVVEHAEAVEGAPAFVDPAQRRQSFAASVLRLFPYLLLRAAAVGESMIFDRAAPHWCTTCGRDHESDGAYVSEEVVNGELRAAWLRCQRADKHAAALHSVRWCHDDGPRASARPLDEFDGLGYGTGAGRNLRRINARYNADGIAAGSTRDTAIRSVWGTGKTVYDVREAIDAIDRARAANHDAFVLHATMRLSLTGATVGGFSRHDKKYWPTDYRKIAGQLDPKNHTKHRHVVFQVESLKRIPKECPAPDLLIIDEPEAMFQHMFGSDGPLSADKAASASSLRSLVQRAGRVILLDNDLTEAHVAAFESLRAGRPGYEGFDVIINEAKPWAGMDFEIFRGDLSHYAVRLAALSFIRRENVKRDAGEPWNGCVVACHSLDEARAVFRMARTVLGENPDDPAEGSAGKLYTSETSGIVKARDFADAGTSWDKAPFVVHTGTVTVGVSHDNAHMSHAFGIFNDKNATAEGSAQMLFRSRQLRSVLVGFKGSCEAGLPHTQAELLRWLVQPFNRHNIPDGLRDDRNPLAGQIGETSSDPEALRRAVDNFEGRVFVAATLSRLRSRADWLGRFTRTIENAGIVPRIGVNHVESFAESLEALGVDPEILAEFGKHKNEFGKEVDPYGLARGLAWNGRAALIAVNAEAAAAAYAVRVAEGTQEQPRITTEEEHAGDEGARLATMLRVGVEEITPEWVAHYGKNRGAIATRFDRLNRLANRPAALDADKTGRRRLDCPAIASEREGCAHAVETLRVLGLELGSADGATITPATLTAAEPTARAVAAVAQRLYGYSKSARALERAGDRMKPPAVLALLNVAADYLGAKIKSHYATETARKNGKPTAYRLRWAWTRPDTMEGGPEVIHPVGNGGAAAVLAVDVAVAVAGPKKHAYTVEDVFE